MPSSTGLLRAGSSAADQLTVRRHNLSVVLSQLRDHGPRSRARLAEETGLNKATVSSLVSDLAERGLVREGGIERATVGRPGQSIQLDGDRVVAVGAEVNVGYVAVLALDLRGRVVVERRIALDTAHLPPARVLGELAGLLGSVVELLAASGVRPVGLTVALPGLVETETGVLRSAPNLRWTDVAVAAHVRALLDDPPYPVLVGNEANLAALAEIDAGGPGRSADLILLTGSVGVGGGIVAGGQLLRGTRGFAGEVGHLRVRGDGPVCGCGRTGCWEAAVGLDALLTAAAPRDDPVHDPSRDVEQRLAEIARRAAAGDARVLAAIDEIDRWLAVGAGILVNVFNPERLVLGGYFAALQPWIAGSLREELQHHVFAGATGSTRIEFSTLGFSGAVRGGAAQALDRIFSDPTLVGHTGEHLPVAQEAMT
ncbi:ROK family transcriptional regulator [Kineococcus rubinsiae]|uniref:ROK family transcriptional regulator n=1 Tax=Kineococcus rubinsiae TaxID=2609562 RepID=UPI0014314AFC|nr:ROK family transcriptional regulator [Kineococcus rubinsiae]NIZ92797.1 ROK family transcriptional regulator [Kineococcus rubinsiae]